MQLFLLSTQDKQTFSFVNLLKVKGCWSHHQSDLSQHVTNVWSWCKMKKQTTGGCSVWGSTVRWTPAVSATSQSLIFKWCQVNSQHSKRLDISELVTQNIAREIVGLSTLCGKDTWWLIKQHWQGVYVQPSPSVSPRRLKPTDSWWETGEAEWKEVQVKEKVKREEK